MTTTTRCTAGPESCYRAVKIRDRRFDGVFYTAVRTTGIYCRPSCPARTPGVRNVTFHPTAAAAQAAGFRACKRCLPDATPGSPEWDVAADVAGRAMRLIADGVVDREGVEGLAARIGYTPRHLTPPAHRGARRRPARPGPRPARPDRPGADRDHRPGVRRRRLRGRLRQRPAVQRHDPRGLRRRTRPSCAGAAAGHPTGGHGRAAAGRPDAVRRRARCWRSSPRARSRASRRPAHGWYARTLAPPARDRHRRASSSTDHDEPGRRPSSPATFAPRRPARPAAGGRARPPAPRRRLRPASRSTTRFAGDPVLGPLVARHARAPRARARRRRRARGPCRARPAGHGGAARTVAARLTAAHGRPVGPTPRRR